MIDFRSVKSAFRPVLASTLSHYKKPMCLCVALMVRFLESEPEHLGKFNLAGHLGQVKAAIKLRDYFVACKGELDDNTAGPLIHNVLDALLRPQSLPDARVACPTDQVLMLMSLISPGVYVTARNVQSTCSAFQYCFRCIFVHVARLRAMGTTAYQHWEPVIIVPSSLGIMEGKELDDSESEGDYVNSDSDVPSDIEGVSNEGMYIST